ncbi:MAG: MBL fold metallo-hydrolase [Acetatifactor sp.]
MLRAMKRILGWTGAAIAVLLFVGMFAKEPVSDEKPAEQTIVCSNPIVSQEPVVSSDAEQESVVSSSVERVTDPSDGETEKSISSFSIHFIDVGQGDATLIQCDGESMLIDAGGFVSGTAVQLYLKKQGVTKLKIVLGTHPDADHIGGLDVILTKFDCETVLLTDKVSDNKAYQEVLDALAHRNYQSTVPKWGDSYTLGSAVCTVIGPIDPDGEDRNSSIVCKVEYGNTSFLLSGDAEAEEERQIMDTGADLSATVYHAGHHGSKTSSCDDWLKAISPEAIVISCGADNPYGHPHAETLAAFRQLGADVYRTDEQGTIVVTSDGECLSWSCEPSETWLAGTSTVNESETAASMKPEESKEEITSAREPEESKEETADQITYVLNKNTKKFHKPKCSSVTDIKQKNRLDVDLTREEVIDMGYVPCKRCKP